MRLAFATGAVIGLLAPAVGFFLVQRNMSLVGDGVGHTAFAGVAAGYLLGRLARAHRARGGRRRRRRDRVAALPASRRRGPGARAPLLHRARGRGRPRLLRRRARRRPLLVPLRLHPHGDARATSCSSSSSASPGSPLIGLLYRALAAVVIDEEGARVAGVPVAALNVLVAGLAGVTIGLSMRIVGILLIAALMVLPVIAAGRVAWSMSSSVLLAMGIGLALRLRRPDGRVLRRSGLREGRSSSSLRPRSWSRASSKPSARGRDPYAHASVTR